MTLPVSLLPPSNAVCCPPALPLISNRSFLTYWQRFSPSFERSEDLHGVTNHRAPGKMTPAHFRRPMRRRVFFMWAWRERLA